MTIPQGTTAESSLRNDWLQLVRRYLSNRWVLLGLAGVAGVLGFSFGGWGWLVAAGLLPVLLSTLPCLIMCGFGVCMMCRSGAKQSTGTGVAEVAAVASPKLGIAEVQQPAIGGSTCCGTGGAPSQNAKQSQSHDERIDSHA